jgi:hypothetical protein
MLREIEAFLKLRGISSYEFSFELGFENIDARNGRPCVVGVRVAAQRPFNIYFGVTKDRIWVSAIETDWRSLT